MNIVDVILENAKLSILTQFSSQHFYFQLSYKARAKLQQLYAQKDQFLQTKKSMEEDFEVYVDDYAVIREFKGNKTIC